jgi:TolA protein
LIHDTQKPIAIPRTGFVTNEEGCFASLMAYRNDNLDKALLVSIALHAAILSLQFGVPGKGLPWKRKTSSATQVPAIRPTIQATLVAPPRTAVPTPVVAAAPVPLSSMPIKPPHAPTLKFSTPGSFAASLLKKPIEPVKTAKKPAPRKAAKAPKPPSAPKGLAVFSTRNQTPWHVATEQTARKEETEKKDEPPVIEKARKEKKHASPKVTEDIDLKRKEEKKKSEEQALVKTAEAEAHKKLEAQAAEEKRKQDQAASARTAEETLERKKNEALAQATVEEKNKEEQSSLAKAEAQSQERKRAETLAQARAVEEKRREEQAALAKAAEDAQERKKAEAMAVAAEEKIKVEQAAQLRTAEEKRREEQAALAKAQQEALAKASQAEAQERARLAEAAAAAKAERDAREISRAASAAAAANAAANATAQAAANSGTNAAAGHAEGGKQSGAAKQGVQAGVGSDLARRALDMAKNGIAGLPLNLPVNSGQSSTSILGRNPNEAQVKFYGDGWIQKVERLFPRLPKTRNYEPLLVTVSINSNGTVAGVSIDRSSGNPELDNTVRKIVAMCSPFAVFPPDLKRNYDVIPFTRTWIFEDGQLKILQ